MESLLLGVEVYHQTPKETGGETETAFNLGAVYDISEQHHILLSAGRSLDGPTRLQCYLGWQFTFESGSMK